MAWPSCRTYPKLAPENNSRAVSWPFSGTGPPLKLKMPHCGSQLLRGGSPAEMAASSRRSGKASTAWSRRPAAGCQVAKIAAMQKTRFLSTEPLPRRHRSTSSRRVLMFYDVFDCVVELLPTIYDNLRCFTTIENTVKQSWLTRNMLCRFKTIYNNLQQLWLTRNILWQCSTIFNNYARHATFYHNWQQFTTIYKNYERHVTH